MNPHLHPGSYIITTVQSPFQGDKNAVIGEFKELEGTTLILEKSKADEWKLAYDFVAAWITLKVHSPLSAVGLTAVFSVELAKHGVSCNVVAGYYHDHIFVPKTEENRAIEVLRALSKKTESTNSNIDLIKM